METSVEPVRVSCRGVLAWNMISRRVRTYGTGDHDGHVLPRGEAEHAGAAGRFFRAERVEVITVEDGMGRGSPWPESILQLQQMAGEMERQGQGTVAAAMIECPPLAVQTVPFGSMTERALRREGLHDNWKAWLVNQIEEGLRPKILKSRR